MGTVEGPGVTVKVGVDVEVGKETCVGVALGPKVRLRPWSWPGMAMVIDWVVTPT